MKSKMYYELKDVIEKTYEELKRNYSIYDFEAICKIADMNSEIINFWEHFQKITAKEKYDLYLYNMDIMEQRIKYATSDQI